MKQLKFDDPIKIVLGCGTLYEEGYFNIDIDTKLKADLHADFTEGLPMLPDGCAMELKSSDMLEHTIDKVSVINEMGRLLMAGGELIISVPYAFSPAAHQDPTHVSYWVPESFGFQYWTEPPSFLGLQWSFAPQKVELTDPNEDGNQWVVARLLKQGKNPHYNPEVISEYARLRNRVKANEKHLEMLNGLVSTFMNSQGQEVTA